MIVKNGFGYIFGQVVHPYINVPHNKLDFLPGSSYPFGNSDCIRPLKAI